MMGREVEAVWEETRGTEVDTAVEI